MIQPSERQEDYQVVCRLVSDNTTLIPVRAGRDSGWFYHINQNNSQMSYLLLECFQIPLSPGHWDHEKPSWVTVGPLSYSHVHITQLKVLANIPLIVQINKTYFYFRSPNASVRSLPGPLHTPIKCSHCCQVYIQIENTENKDTGQGISLRQSCKPPVLFLQDSRDSKIKQWNDQKLWFFCRIVWKGLGKDWFHFLLCPTQHHLEV